MSIGSSTPAHRAFLTELRLPDVFRMMMIRGALAVVFGVLALAWPTITALALALLFGIYALVNGVSMLVAAIRGDELFHRWLVALSGLVSIGAGVVTLFWPGITVLVLTIVVGVWALVIGLSEIVAVVRLRRVLAHKAFLLITGILSVIAGVLLVWHPFTGALGIAIVLGSYAVAYGLLLIGVAAWLRHTLRRMTVD